MSRSIIYVLWKKIQNHIKSVNNLSQFRAFFNYKNHAIAIAMSSSRPYCTEIEYSTGLTGGI